MDVEALGDVGTDGVEDAFGFEGLTAFDDVGERFVGAVFTIKAVSRDGPQQQDSDSNAALVGSDGQTYLPDIIPIVGYTDFAVGEIHAAPGESTTGDVAFQVPTGVKVSKVQWSTFSSLGVESTIQWNVP